MQDAPIVIIGGGPTGLACALLLGQAGFRSTVIDARSVEQAQQDRRLLALSRGSWQLLQPLLRDQSLPTAAIRDVLVSSAGEFGVTRLRAAEFQVDSLGATVFYGDLLNALHAAAQSHTLIEQQRPARALRVQQTPHAVEVALEPSGSVHGSLLIDAEGAPPGSRSTAAALIGDVDIQGPQAGQAFERFTREGPLALLPTPQRVSSGQFALSLVWCMETQRAAERMRMDHAALLRELQQVIGPRIGTLRGFITPLRSVPLQHHLRERVQEHRRIALGNAAQALHPVAGQGFNLALRDCAKLVQHLSDYPSDPPRALHEYARARNLDRRVVGSITRWLPEIFATRFQPVALARSWGLTALDLSPLLRRELAHLLTFGVRK